MSKNSIQNTIPNETSLRITSDFMIGKSVEDSSVKKSKHTVILYFEILKELTSIPEKDFNKNIAMRLSNEFNVSTDIIYRLRRSMIVLGWKYSIIRKQEKKLQPAGIMTCSKLKNLKVEA